LLPFERSTSDLSFGVEGREEKKREGLWSVTRILRDPQRRRGRQRKSILRHLNVGEGKENEEEQRPVHVGEPRRRHGKKISFSLSMKRRGGGGKRRGNSICSNTI